MAMCAVDLDERPPLELLFTVEEETGLVGASHMSADLISSNYLLNLDNEANNELCIGMASIVQADVQVPLKYMNPPENYHFYTFSIQGLHGGHSGVDIHQPFGNAIILFFEILGSYEHSVCLLYTSPSPRDP
mgnify:FL=1